jgi:hypothetical protein
LTLTLITDWPAPFLPVPDIVMAKLSVPLKPAFGA